MSRSVLRSSRLRRIVVSLSAMCVFALGPATLAHAAPSSALTVSSAPTFENARWGNARWGNARWGNARWGLSADEDGAALGSDSVITI
jgi:hypothetical protein